MYLFGVKYCYNLDRLQIACCHLVFVKKSPSFQNMDIFPELDRCTPCVFIGTVARFSRNKSLLISFGAPVIKYKVERDERYLSYIELGRWLCSHFQLETPLNFQKPITHKLYNLEK